MSDLCKEARAAGPGEREGASPLAGKVSSALCTIEIGTEQITSRASCSGGAGVVHLMKTQRIRVGDREGKVLPPSTGRVRGQGSPAASPFLQAHRCSEWTLAVSENPDREGRRREGMGVWQAA